ncbi:MAG: hypothetical protein RR357_05960 [Clostridia bacterium]
MKSKKEVFKDEKIAEILKKVKSVDMNKAYGELLISSKCSKCGRELSGLEKVTFFKKCAVCAKTDAEHSRDNFFKRYALIATLFVFFVIVGGVFSNAAGKAMQVMATVFQAITIGISVFYVASKVIPQIVPGTKQKIVLLISMGFAMAIDLVLIMIIIFIKTSTPYIIFLFAMVVYIAYEAYVEYLNIKQQYKLLEVYNRKSIDEEYVKTIADAVNSRDTENKISQINNDNLNKEKNKNEFVENSKSESLSNEESNEKTSDECSCLMEKEIKNDSVIENNEIEKEAVKKVDKDKLAEDKKSNNNSSDDGGCWII